MLKSVLVILLFGITSTAYSENSMRTGSPLVRESKSGTRLERKQKQKSPVLHLQKRQKSLENTWKLRLDIELDPLAFVANGFSVHGGLRFGRFRFDLGAFGADVPGFFLTAEGFDVRMTGFGTKLDYRFFGQGSSPFVGVEFARVKKEIMHRASRAREAFFQHTVGIRVGYQIALYRGLYLVPWLGIGFPIERRDVRLGGAELPKEGVISFFPTIHIGYRIP